MTVRHVRFVTLALAAAAAACGGHAGPAAAPPARHEPDIAVRRTAGDASGDSKASFHLDGPATSLATGKVPTGAVPWPIAAFSPAQRAEVKACDVATLAGRYAGVTAIDKLAKAFRVKTACDRAVLATSCATLAGTAPLPKPCLDAYQAVLAANPAFALAHGVVESYWGRSFASAPPGVATHALEGVGIDYRFSTLGRLTTWGVSATNLTTEPNVWVTGAHPAGVLWTQDLADGLARLRTGLAGFVPIDAPIFAVACTDLYPNFVVTLTFDNGETVALSNHDSNVFGVGGPWQMTIGDQGYVQVGPYLSDALTVIVDALKLPVGTRHGCGMDHEEPQGFDFQAEVLK